LAQPWLICSIAHGSYRQRGIAELMHSRPMPVGQFARVIAAPEKASV
jgi:hypothetical protein